MNYCALTCLQREDGVSADLPTSPYLPVFVRKSTKNKENTQIFLDIRTKSSRNNRNRVMNYCELIANKIDCQALMELSFIDICIR